MAEPHLPAVWGRVAFDRAISVEEQKPPRGSCDQKVLGDRHSFSTSLPQTFHPAVSTEQMGSLSLLIHGGSSNCPVPGRHDQLSLDEASQSFPT